MKLMNELYLYREMIFSLVRRDLKGRYKGSVLGFLWTFLNPLLQLGVYTLVFSVIMRNGIKDYYLFLFVALIPWIFFSTCVSGGATCIMTQKEMVKKIYFPRQVLPLAFVTSQFVNMLLSFVVVIPILIISGKGIDLLAVTFLPLIMIIEYTLALGMAMLVSAITVYLRDTEYILGIITMAWQFLSPVIYSIDQVPEEIRPIFLLNPMTSILTAYRDILYYKQVPQVSTLLNAVVMGVGLMLISLFVFHKLSKRFAEEL
ncbi:ABC transporter permease [Lacrimispora amygdalina]|uniref:Transport permease protein n=1 Tax=Lacrimispora amygdalina TaxID=253257 RepID=A0A3E2N4Q1_9FIRM|nr:ABC transporter permease [Clostridium indicum]RFZ75977.1 ABC transporter permease [Clostridium indicum]